MVKVSFNFILINMFLVFNILKLQNAWMHLAVHYLLQSQNTYIFIFGYCQVLNFMFSVCLCFYCFLLLMHSSLLSVLQTPYTGHYLRRIFGEINESSFTSKLTSNYIKQELMRASPSFSSSFYFLFV